MDNSTSLQLHLSENDGPLNSPGFMVFSILLVVATLVAGLMMGFTILALLKGTSIPGLIRLFLVNLLLSGLLVAVALMFVVVTSTVLIAVGLNDPRPRYLCRVYLWAFGSGVVARLWSLAAFSFSILAIVRFGKKTITKWSAAVILLALWLVPMILSIYTMLPYVYEAQFVHGVACFPDTGGTDIVQARYAFITTWTIFGGLTPLTVSIIVPIICLCYIRKNTISEGTQYRRGMAKLSLFLVVGGGINIAGQILPALLTFTLAAPGVYLCYGCIAVSLFPTPIIIMVFLKPVQIEAKKILTCGQHSKEGMMMKRAPSTSCEAALSVEKL